jgi:hypothetical protein
MQYVDAPACGAMGQSHGLLHALTAWDLEFQVCLGCIFTPATLTGITFHHNGFTNVSVLKKLLFAVPLKPS